MEKDDILDWSKDRPLMLSDFLAESNPGEFADALSTIKYHHTWTVKSEMIDGRVHYYIDNIHLQTQFLRHLSWIREQNASQTLLKHQQGHFDLAEWFRPMITERILSKFKGKKFPTRGKNDEQKKQFAKEDSGLMILTELEKYYKDLQSLRKKYDDETEFGLNSDKQNDYDEKFFRLRN